MTEAEELVEKKLTNSDENISSSELLVKIFSDILRRIKNIETLTESQWKDVTLVIDNVDSIDQTNADKLYLEYLNSSTKDGVENASDQKPEKKGLDIYDLADDPLYENADYYDIHTGNTYLLAQYNRARRFGLPVDGIHVIMADGTHGICQRME